MQTNDGVFNGDQWEHYCQKILRTKYSIQYQEVPDLDKGDLGIEGYTQDGQVFQCYCPEQDLEIVKLYEAQRRKINSDINKLVKNIQKIGKITGGISIKYWVFITPKYNSKRLLEYCRTKESEVRGKGLPLLDKDFSIRITDLDCYVAERALLMQFMNLIPALPDSPIKEEDYLSISGQSSKNIRNKYSKISSGDKLQKLVQREMDNNIKGQFQVNNLKNIHPDIYSKLIDLESALTNDLPLFHEYRSCKNLGEFLNSLQEEICKRIKNQFPSFEEILLTKLSNFFISEWIANCPLEFNNGN